MLGSVDRSHVFRLIEALAQGDGKTVVEISEALRMPRPERRVDAGGDERGAAAHGRDPGRAVGAGDPGDPEAAEIARLAGLMPADETQLLYSMCLHGRAELGLAPDEYAALTMVLLRLLAFKAPAVRSGSGRGAPATAEKKTLSEAGAAPRGSAPRRQHACRPAAAAAAAARFAFGTPGGPVARRRRGGCLPVVEQRREPAAQRPGGAPPPNGRPAGEVVGVPVHVQAESAREPAAPAGRLVPTEEGDFWQATVADLVAREADHRAGARTGAAVAAGGARRGPLDAARRARVAEPARQPRAPAAARCRRPATR